MGSTRVVRESRPTRLVSVPENRPPPPADWPGLGLKHTLAQTTDIPNGIEPSTYPCPEVPSILPGTVLGPIRYPDLAAPTLSSHLPLVYKLSTHVLWVGAGILQTQTISIYPLSVSFLAPPPHPPGASMAATTIRIQRRAASPSPSVDFATTSRRASTVLGTRTL